MLASLYPRPAVAGVIAVPGSAVHVGDVLFLDGVGEDGRVVESVARFNRGTVNVRVAGVAGSIALNRVDGVWVVRA
jgi:hypothetical protein